MLLTPKPDAVSSLKALNQLYEGSLLGWRITKSPHLDDSLAYWENIRSLLHSDCDCNDSYRDLEEGYYPFDLRGTPATGKALAVRGIGAWIGTVRCHLNPQVIAAARHRLLIAPK